MWQMTCTFLQVTVVLYVTVSVFMERRDKPRLLSHHQQNCHGRALPYGRCLYHDTQGYEDGPTWQVIHTQLQFKNGASIMAHVERGAGQAAQNNCQSVCNSHNLYRIMSSGQESYYLSSPAEEHRQSYRIAKYSNWKEAVDEGDG